MKNRIQRSVFVAVFCAAACLAGAQVRAAEDDQEPVNDEQAVPEALQIGQTTCSTPGSCGHCYCADAPLQTPPASQELWVKRDEPGSETKTLAIGGGPDRTGP